ncbi:hypothetical protein F4778DRAFT_301504 [Xylariomycetidae sp. FL2044]|nr:hypothetical protein F4778DRAFT_301504 [Xylariomycetidae sp. FL2044]
MDGHNVVGAVSAPSLSMSPTSPMSLQRRGSMKRKRSIGPPGPIDSSPGSGAGDDDHSMIEPEKKRQPGVKRACNECRQQKVSQPIPPYFSSRLPPVYLPPPASCLPLYPPPSIHLSTHVNLPGYDAVSLASAVI